MTTPLSDFPSNSKKSKEKQKIEPVVTGKVVQRKPSLGKRLRETLVSGDTGSVGNYILFEVLIPAMKDVVADMVSQGIERVMYGEARSRSRRTGQQPGHVTYNRPVQTQLPWSPARPDPRPVITRRGRADHNFNDIVIATRGEAVEVIDRMGELLQRYNQVTVSDLYELTGITASFVDEKYGWLDLTTANVQRVSGGYLLDLPRPEPLD